MNMSVHKCVHCGEDVDDGNNRTCKKNCTEIKLFGVQIGVSSEDGHGAAAKSLSIRKSKSLDNIVQSCNPAAAAAAAESSGFLIRKSKSLNDVQSCNPDYTAAAESSGYLSDSKSHERKRGKPWSEEEHRSFLEGLEKLGKGDWKGIASKFVTSRKSSQVASHAQKYFNRINLTVSNKKRRRASVFDISPTHIANQPPQGSKSNKAEQSVHIASTASKNVGEFNVRPSTPAHVTTTEKPPLSPLKPSGIPEFRGLICQPRVSSSTKGYLTQTVMASVSWFPVMNFSNQNGVLVPSIRGNFAAVVPTSVDLNTWRHRWFEAGSAPSTTNNEELSLHIRNLALQ